MVVAWVNFCLDCLLVAFIFGIAWNTFVQSIHL